MSNLQKWKTKTIINWILCFSESLTKNLVIFFANWWPIIKNLVHPVNRWMTFLKQCSKHKIQTVESTFIYVQFSSQSINFIYIFADINNEALTGRSVTLYFEGSETSSISFSFALYELAKNPDVQDRLYAEICDTLKKNNGELTFDALNEMKYLENIFLEALRLHSPVLYLAKCCSRSYTLPSIGNNAPVTIKPGTSVLIPVRALHLWVSYSANQKKKSPSKYLYFIL